MNFRLLTTFLAIFPIAALLALPLFVSSGCAGYRLGSMLPDDIKTVYIPSIRNTTTEPLLEAETTQALLRELQTDGSLKIANEDEADAILEIQLNKYQLRPLIYTREDRSRPAEYTVQLTASMRLVRASDGMVLVDHPYVSGDFFVPFVTDLTSAKRRVLPDVSRDLAHDIVELLVEAWADTGGLNPSAPSDPNAGWHSGGPY